jgi:hypothetical protein
MIFCLLPESRQQKRENFLLDQCRWLAPAVASQALPEKGMIPDLGGIIKNVRFVGEMLRAGSGPCP